jgi:general secretion pathway protein B
MSFILDALKKSEMERQRQAVPGLVDSSALRPRPRLPVWGIALGFLLAVNLIVVSFLLLRSSMSGNGGHGQPAAAGHDASAPAASGPAQTAPREHFSPLDAAPVYAPEIPMAGAPTAAASAPSPAAPVTAIAGNAAVRPPHHRDPVLTDDDYKPADEEVLPTISELDLTGAQALPELHLDVHVYATKASERFVYINMRKYHEGATLQEGPTVERIRRDGVILNFHSLRFLLPRQ